MSDSSAGQWPGDQDPTSEQPTGQLPDGEDSAQPTEAAPHRVIGTPPPAQARPLLGTDVQAGDGAAAPSRELPG